MPSLQPLRLLLTAVAGWVYREQAATIAYLIEENRVLRREQLGKRRLHLTDDRNCCTDPTCESCRAGVTLRG